MIVDKNESLFSDLILKYEREREYFYSIQMLKELGTNLPEFGLISDIACYLVFINKNNMAKKYKKFSKKLNDVLVNIINLNGFIPRMDSIMSLEDIIVMKDKKMFLTFNYFFQKFENEYSDFIEHLEESHDFQFEEINFLEIDLLRKKAMLASFIKYNNLDTDYQEYENEIKVTLAYDPAFLKFEKDLKNEIENKNGDEDENI